MTSLPTAPTLTLTGEVDLARTGAVRADLETLLATGPSRLRIDLAGVTFLDCAGLRVLGWAVARGERQGVAVELTAPSRAVRRLLELVEPQDGLARAS